VRYYFSKVLALGFDAAVGVVTQNLRDEGFGIITEVDAQRQDRRGVSPYRILGACNPSLAQEALSLRTRSPCYHAM
jgi:uncharacterized protein (DUF302 family)